MSTTTRAAHTIPELVMAWGRGWTVSRRTAPPVAVAGGFRVDVGLPGHRVRHILHSHTHDSLAALADRQTEAGNWIRIAGPTALLRQALPPDWTMDAAGHLMTTAFTAGRVDAPHGYVIEVETEGDRAVARARDEHGEAAASAQLGRTGAFGVIDQVRTEPAHQRRGLGTALMSALSDRATELGATTGILVGTDAGRALYEALGWTYRSDFPGAFRKEDGGAAA